MSNTITISFPPALESKLDFIINKISDLEKQMTLPQIKEDNKLLTRLEAAEMLQVNLSTLYKWVKSGKIAQKKLGKKVYFTRESIENALINIDLSDNNQFKTRALH